MKKIWLLLFIACCLVPGVALPADDGKEAADDDIPQKTAENWLKLVDDHKYGQSWKEAALSLQKTVPEDRWHQVMGTVRDALGKPEDRRFSKIKLQDKLPGLASGHYAIVQFKTVFEGKSDAIETVYLEHRSEDVWKVCGYYVR